MVMNSGAATQDTLQDTLILGVGSPLLGDDALGIRVIELLRTRPDLPPCVSLVDGGTDGLGLIPVIEQYRRVICVDAVMMDAPPGTVRRLTWGEFRVVAQSNPLSLHQSDLGSALQLADALGCLPEELVIYGVQPQTMDWGSPLSPAVERALPAVMNALLADIGPDC